MVTQSPLPVNQTGGGGYALLQISVPLSLLVRDTFHKTTAAKNVFHVIREESNRAMAISSAVMENWQHGTMNTVVHVRYSTWIIFSKTETNTTA